MYEMVVVYVRIEILWENPEREENNTVIITKEDIKSNSFEENLKLYKKLWIWKDEHYLNEYDIFDFDKNKNDNSEKRENMDYENFNLMN
jgi:hypothetical protein